MRPTDAVLARHWLSHPGESAYQAARHVGMEPRTVQKAAERLRDRVGLEPAALLRYLREHPIRSPKTLTLRHPAVDRWLQKTPHPFLLSGEDAALLDGWDLVPSQHLVYVDAETLAPLVHDALDAGARLAGPEASNLVVRQRDPWLVDEDRVLAERGQRLLDYLESRNVQFLIQLRERMPEALP